VGSFHPGVSLPFLRSRRFSSRAGVPESRWTTAARRLRTVIFRFFWYRIRLCGRIVSAPQPIGARTLPSVRVSSSSRKCLMTPGSNSPGSMRPCPACSGRGTVPCSRCRGSGTLHMPSYSLGPWQDLPLPRECPGCEGDGKLDCSACRGKGFPPA